ncbi:MAG: hypothetical protein M3Y09_08495 [Actinomycetota bacterium]|nr:hypothetical protein [Actinomycetota bacterium]
MSRYPLILSAVTAALVLAACGSSGSSSAASGTSSAASTAAAAQPAKATSSAAGGPYAAGAYGGQSTAAATPPATRITITAKSDHKLGMILAAGPREMTVYMFRADHGNRSSCSGACASAWPPVTGHPSAAGAAVAADLGTVKRSDGTLQVTYRGRPLYHYVKDGDAKDAYGAGISQFGAPWYTLSPSGRVIDNS